MDGRDARSLRPRAPKGGAGTAGIGAGDDDTEVPAFVVALLSILDQADTQDLCHWMPSGNTFVVEDPDR